jgi:PleD family two-component response regulator
MSSVPLLYSLGIALSMGVAMCHQPGKSIESVLHDTVADAALYRGQQEGRDQVIVLEKGY